MSRILENAENQITNGFSQNHVAVDVVKNRNQLANIIAHSAGKVMWVQTGYKNAQGSSGNASYGNAVKIKHSNGYYTLYAHLNRVDVKVGQEVKQGQVIGYMGNSGNAYGAHLHFEVRNEKDVRINPTPYINSDLPNMVKKEEKPNSNEIFYTVVPGDTLTAIARKYNTTVNNLVKINNIANPNLIVVGQKIKISGKDINVSTTQKYTVQVGDTVSAICRKFYKRSTKTEWDKIKNANNLNSSYLIKAGQVLIIP